MQSLQAQAHAIAGYYTPPSVGRPSDIGDATLLQELFAAIADGNYLETSCHLVGLAPATVYNWKKRGEQGEQPYARFVETLKRAEAQAEAKMLANVRKASELPQFWAAGMTVLERRHPERWSKRQDDSQAPKVVVNIGVTDGDVKVGIATFASNASTVSDDLHRLTDETGSYKNQLCKPTALAIDSVPAQASAPIEAESCGEIAKGTLPGRGRLSGSQGARQVKGRRAAKKKGLEP